MISALLAVAGVFIFLVLVEFITRKQHLKGESPRKLIHIGVGSFVAFWPFFMSIHSVLWLSAALFIVVFISKFFHIFESIHTVRRYTMGELFFPLGIGLAALLAQSKWIFLAAVLHMSLADGLAGLIGMRFAKKRRGVYKVFGRVKTIAGSTTFFVASAFITSWVILCSNAGFSQTAWPVIIVLPVLATFLENVSPDGSDNLFVPLFVVGVLGSLQFIF
jgi:phytol kinase